MKIVVIGVGHMGSWFARELANEGNEVAVFDKNPENTKKLTGVSVFGTLAELREFIPDMLLNAVSIRQTAAAFDACKPYLPDHCVLVDVTSVKGDLPKYYQQGKFRYASLHPMFGPTFANVNDLREENVILISESDPNIKELFRTFFSSRGVNIFEFSFTNIRHSRATTANRK